MRPAAVGMTVWLATAAGAVATTTLPGWTEGSLALAGNDLIVTQSGPISAGPLRYQRTDAWRLPMAAGGRVGPGTRPVTVRTSAGPTTVAPLVAGPDGAFALIAAGVGFAPPVVWCCEASTRLQQVLESDGRPDARRAVAIGLDGPRVRYVARDGDRAVVVSVDPLRGGRRELPVPGRPSVGGAAVSGDDLAWIDRPAYDRGAEVRRARITERGIDEVRSLAPAGEVVAVHGADGTLVVLVRGRSGWRVLRSSMTGGGLRVVWSGRSRPLVAVGSGVVAVAVDRSVLTGRGATLRPAARLGRSARAVAVGSRRVAWLEWAIVGGRRRTVPHWATVR